MVRRNPAQSFGPEHEDHATDSSATNSPLRSAAELRGLMLLPTLLSEISSHDLEVAETLIGVLRFILIFVAARTLAEVLVRFELPTILGELLAGVILGASGLHLLVPPATQVQLSGVFTDAIAALAHIPGEDVTAIYDESFGALRSVPNPGL